MSVKSKNIHVLPTDKPSRLGYLTKKGKEVFKDLRLFDRLMPNILDSENQHIYITSDKEIKEGDWVIYQKFMFPLKVVLDQDGYHIINNGIGEVVGDYYSLQERYKKIILTTDQDLIKDGVQAINDEFLEWFVKNPSCERVEVVDVRNLGVYGSFYPYKIIIPKEEPKQETLEEVAEKIFKTYSNNTSLAEGHYEYMMDKEDFKQAFSEIAKWQAERMYSDLSELRNDLYDKLPIGDIDAFEILKVIKNHLQKLDALCGNK